MSKQTLERYREELRGVISALPEGPYSWSAEAKDGVSSDVTWNGVRLYKAAKPHSYYCVGAVAQATLTALKRMGMEKQISFEVMKKWRPYLFLYAENPVKVDDPYFKGGPGGMVELGIGDFVDDPRDAQYGDVAQIWHVNRETGIAIQGHAVIVTGQVSKSKGPAIKDWSASPTMDGIGNDWHYLNYVKKKDGKKYDRRIIVARWNFDKIAALKGGE